MRHEEKSMRLPYGLMRLSMQQLAAWRGLSHLEEVEYEESYVPSTLHSYYITCYSDELRLHFPFVWIALLNALIRCAEPCGLRSFGFRLLRQFVFGLRGTLEIYLVTKGEHESLLNIF